MKKLLTIILVIAPSLIFSNNIAISTVSTFGQVPASDYTFVQFDLNWDNSWRTSTGPSNWDAAWVFVKYKIDGGTGCTAGDWEHATLSTTSADHSVTTDNGIVDVITSTADGKGVFLYRNADGTGSINWDQVRLRWNYGVDGLLDACEVTIKVFAVEMVYVPQSNFFLGSGGTSDGEFESATSGSPLLITSDASITLGGGGAGSLGNNNTTGQNGAADDFNDVTSQTLPAAFPLGYDAFYCMKYELSNEQYSDFLNSLTATQQGTRASTIIAGNFHGNSATPLTRSGLKCRIAPSGSSPGLYGCDLDDDETYNEVASDGLNIAIGRISWPDVAGYLDWSGLRPFTETEYEKACRGNQLPVVGEYAWGTASRHSSTYTALTNSGAEDELPNAPSASTTIGNVVYSTTHSAGPLRVGVFATASSTRVISGATYYGIMEMTGNVWENAVSLGSIAGRAFTGLHGDGSLNTNGQADVDYWPGINGNNSLTTANAVYGGTTGVTGRAGIGFHGGSFQGTTWLEVCNRDYSYWSGLTGRDQRNSGRGVRTAP